MTSEPPAPLADRPVRGFRSIDDPGEAGLDWDDFVGRCTGDNLVQTTAWMRLKQSQGFETRRVVLAQEGKIKAGALMIVKRLGPVGAIGYVARGPLLAFADAELVARVIADIEAEARAARVLHLIVQPAAGGELVEAELRRRGYTTAFVKLAADATMRLELQPSTDEILARMSSSKRRNIRRAFTNGRVHARLGDRADVTTFRELHAATALRHNFKPLSLEALQQRWDALAPAGHVHLVLCYVDGLPCAGTWLTACGDTVTARMSGWRREGAKFYPNEYRYWWGIQWAKRQGFRYYDFGNCDRKWAERTLAGEDVREKDLSSTDAYKKQMGAEVVLLPTAYQHTLSPLLRPLLSVARHIQGPSRFLRRLAEGMRNG